MWNFIRTEEAQETQKPSRSKLCGCVFGVLTGRSWRGGTAHRQASSLGTWANHMQPGQRACNNTHPCTCSSRPGGGERQTDGHTRQKNRGTSAAAHSEILNSARICWDEYIISSHQINWWIWFITTFLFAWREIYTKLLCKEPIAKGPWGPLAFSIMFIST